MPYHIAPKVSHRPQHRQHPVTLGLQGGEFLLYGLYLLEKFVLAQRMV